MQGELSSPQTTWQLIYIDGDSRSELVVGQKQLAPSSLTVSDSEHQADRWLRLGGQSFFFHSVSHKLCATCYRRKHKPPAVGREWVIPGLRRIDNTRNSPQVTIQVSSGNWKQSSKVIVSDRLCQENFDLIGQPDCSYFLFCDHPRIPMMSIKLFLYLNDSFLK